jgi:hypothetical protein
MWNMKRFVIPVIIGAPGIVTEGLKKSVNNTRRVFSRLSTQTAVLGTSHIVRRNLKPTIGSRRDIPGETYDKR